MTKGFWEKYQGQVVDDTFPLRRYLGGTSYSAVFLTEYGSPQTQNVAIKLVPSDSATEEILFSRWQEAAKLVHPRLVKLLGVGRCKLGDAVFLYLVTEYAEENLSQLLPQRPLTPGEAKELLDATVEGLAYIHSKGFIHGHIRPANILAVNDQLKLSIDGLYARGEARNGRSELDVYDPPEAVNGVVSPAGDVWSLGVTLVEGMTQNLPSGHRNRDPVLPVLPEPFAAIAAHSLRRSAEKRWTLAEIASRLQPTALGPASRVPVRSPERRRRSRNKLIMPAVFAAVVIAVMVGAGFFRRTPKVEVPPPVATERPVEPPQSSAESRSGAKQSPAPKAMHVPPARADVAPPDQPASIRTPMRDDIVRQVEPQVAASARRTVHGTIKVNVRTHVDPEGNVSRASFDTRGPSNYFARVAMEAAQQWKFAPAGGDESREWVLRFEFTRSGERVLPEQVNQ